MLSFLPSPIKGVIASLIFAVNTVVWCLLIYPFAIVKIVLPIPAVRRLCDIMMITFAETWVDCNGLEMKLLHHIEWDVEGLEGLSLERSYIVTANHQSWVDIVAVQKILNHRIPFMRFFLKRELMWFPFLNGAWWALDMPFMKRHSKEYLEKHPEKRGEDLETTRRSCERFTGRHLAVINFLEGTRFTAAKHRKQASPYKHLLKPKVGGFAFVLEVLGKQFDSIVDVTICYPDGAKTIWELFSGRIDRIVLRVRQIEIPAELRVGGYLEDPELRARFQAWVHGIWEEKDRLISSLQASHAPTQASPRFG